MFDQVTILAPGLLGASVALAVDERQLARRITVWARRSQTRAYCEKQSWCDDIFETPEEAVKKADLTIVCSPVETIQPIVSRIAQHLKTGARVTDVGSTKSLIAHHCHSAMPPGRAFVGSHPMAGSEKSGPEYAQTSLLKEKPCFVTPLPESDPEAVATVAQFWKSLSMKVTEISPEVHDKIVAHISHLPHILATTLCTHLTSKNSGWHHFAGNGLRDTTRIAGGSPKIWQSIIEQNREEIVCALSEFENELQAMKTALTENQTEEIFHRLEQGKVYRDRLSLTQEGEETLSDHPISP